MPCYVDPMRPSPKRIGWRHNESCHLVCDTPKELKNFAYTLGLSPKWIQDAGTPHEHYDLTRLKRIAAVAQGAQEVTAHELGRILRGKRQAAIQS